MPDAKLRVLWRIASDTPDYGADDGSGRGAEVTGRRWNRKGTPLLYASRTIALACLETIVHLTDAIRLPLNRYLVALEIPNDLFDLREEFAPAANVGWDAEPAGLVSLDGGTQWAQSQRSLILQVPSIVVPEEPNFLLNPHHPDAAHLRARKLRRWTYDTRLRSP